MIFRSGTYLPRRMRGRLYFGTSRPRVFTYNRVRTGRWMNREVNERDGLQRPVLGSAGDIKQILGILDVSVGRFHFICSVSYPSYGMPAELLHGRRL